MNRMLRVRRRAGGAEDGDFPTGRRADLGVPEVTARFDLGDFLGDVEQGVEDRVDFERRPEEVAALQQRVDRSGLGNDLVRGQFEREVDGTEGWMVQIQRGHNVPFSFPMKRVCS